MKTLLFTLFILLSLNTYANQQKNSFVARAEKSASLTDFSGCEDAKESAIEEARSLCYQAGFNECQEVQTRQVSSKSMRIEFATAIPLIPFYIENGKCTFESIVKGIENK